MNASDHDQSLLQAALEHSSVHDGDPDRLANHLVVVLMLILQTRRRARRRCHKFHQRTGAVVHETMRHQGRLSNTCSYLFGLSRLLRIQTPL